MQKITIVLAVGLLAVGACKKEEPASGSGGDKTGVAAPAGGIEVISNGAEPRKQLRYKVAKGTKTPVEFAMDIDMDAGMAMNMPTLAMMMDIGVDDVSGNGDMKLRTTVNSVTARDRAGASVKASMLNGQLDMMNGLAMTATLSPDGSLKDTKVEPGKNLPASMQSQMSSMTQNLEQVAMPLPPGAVGVGAKWKAKKTIEQNGMKMTTLNTVEITALDGDKMTFKSTSEIGGPDQTVHQNGMSIDMKNIEGGGTGSGTIDLTKLVMSGEFNVHFKAKMKAGEQNANMAMGMKLVLTPKS